MQLSGVKREDVKITGIFMPSFSSFMHMHPIGLVLNITGRKITGKMKNRGADDIK